MAHQHNQHDHHGHHEHFHGHGANVRTLKVSLAVIAAYMLVEAAGGWWTGSLALLSDAGHMLSDAFALAIALLAFAVGARATTWSKTFGFRRIEILIAAINGLTLLLMAAWIVLEAIARLRAPGAIAGGGMLAIAVLGLLVNLFVAWYMLKNGDTEGNVNMQGAYWHVLGDLLGSLGAIIAALLLLAFGWWWADPLASVLVAMLIARSGWRVCARTWHILMEGTPEGVDAEALFARIAAVEGVKSVHDGHVWTITSQVNALTCHVVVDGTLRVDEAEQLLYRIEALLRAAGIGHSTVQVESERHPHAPSVLCNIS